MSMVEIIPSINVSNFAEAKAKIKKVEKYVHWAHLDVSDGVFTKHVSWHEPKDLVGFKTKLKLEIHLMVGSPEKEIEQWLIEPVSRIIFHQEATRDHWLLIKKIREAKKETGIAIKPDTPWLKLFPYLGKIDVFQLLAVIPGPSGQKFDEEIFNEGILHKLGHIRSLCKSCIIEVDGGVNKRVAARCVKEGANLLVAGKAIFEALDIKKAIKELSGKIK